MAHSQSSTAALLYSPQSRDPTLLRLLDQIRADLTLSKGIQVISVDSPYVRNLLQGNESGVTVKKWPVFAVKIPGDRAPTLYPLDSAEKVFELVRPKPSRVVPVLNRSPSIKESISERSLRQVHFEVRSTPEANRLISWNSDLFSEGPISMVVSEGSSVRFVSEDDLVHDVTLTDSTWKPIRRLIPRQKKMNQELAIDRQLLKAIERGRCHLISSLPQDRQMRLVLRLLNPIDEIINGMSEVDSSSSKREVAPPRREVAPPRKESAPPRTWKFIKDEPDDWSLIPEKSGPIGLRTNPLVARVRIPQAEKAAPQEIESPPLVVRTSSSRSSWAQRLLAKLE